VDLRHAIAAYAQGLFPMDDAEDPHGQLPFYLADPRAVFDLSEAGLARVRRAVRRSLARDEGWVLVLDRDYEAVLAGCMAARPKHPGVWITPRLADLYRQLNAAGVSHSFELRSADGSHLLAGVLGVVLNGAAFLETMCHFAPDAGNVGLLRTLEFLAARGITLCDIQMITEHTERLGAVEIPRDVFEARLEAALARPLQGI
jgi:leucyl/phenylalanyl-tRNA---protein transferase